MNRKPPLSADSNLDSRRKEFLEVLPCVSLSPLPENPTPGTLFSGFCIVKAWSPSYGRDNRHQFDSGSSCLGHLTGCSCMSILYPSAPGQLAFMLLKTQKMPQILIKRKEYPLPHVFVVSGKAAQMDDFWVQPVLAWGFKDSPIKMLCKAWAKIVLTRGHYDSPYMAPSILKATEKNGQVYLPKPLSLSDCLFVRGFKGKTVHLSEQDSPGSVPGSSCYG